MTDLSTRLHRLAEFDDRLSANMQYIDTFKFNVHDKITLIGQASALLAIADERCKDLARLQPLIEALIRVAEAAEEYMTGGSQGAADELDDALAALRELGDK